MSGRVHRCRGGWRGRIALAALLGAALPGQRDEAPPDRTAPWPDVAVDGRAIDWEGLRAKAHVVAFFSPRMRDLVPLLRTWQRLHEERRLANLEVIGVCIDPVSPLDLRPLLAEHGFAFPVLIDAERALQASFRPRSIPHVFFFAEQRRFLGDLPGFPDAGSPTPAALYENLLRRAVGLDMRIEHDPSTTPWPPMPEFEIPDSDVSTASLRGAPYLLAFVAADCDRCRDQLQFFRTLHAEFAADGVRIVAVLVDQTGPERFRLERELPFPVFGDPDGVLRRRLGYRGFVPDTLVVDAQARIRYRHLVFDDEQPPLYRMELRRLAGLPNPPILKAGQPSGVRRCMVCHERHYFDWRASGHGHALRSLQAIGRAEEPDCVRCHVVGFGAPGGYDHDRGARAHLLGDVQCESCHGDGGGHLLPAGAPRPRVGADTCVQCHDEEHSLGFDFHRFRPIVDHRTDLLGAGAEQVAAAARLRDEQRRALLEPDGRYVGAAACTDCHAGQAERWRASPHAAALSLLAAGRQDQPECRRCHATGVGRTWAGDGTPGAGVAAGVQCEACHGPGERHVTAGDGASRLATIIGLGARCEECVVRQICTGCHDRANDPDFEFRTALRAVQRMCAPDRAPDPAADGGR